MKWLITLLALTTLRAEALTLLTEEYPPFNFSTDGGQTIHGSVTDVINEVLKRTGIKANMRLYPWERAYKSALDDPDTCVFSTTRTEAREKLFKWVGPLAEDSWVIYARADSPISATSLEDLRRYHIGGYQGDAKTLYLKSRGFKIDETIKDEQNILKLEAGRIDLWAASASIAPWMASKYSVNIKAVIQLQDIELYAACNPAVPDEEIDRMNDAVEAIKADGTFEALTKAYR